MGGWYPELPGLDMKSKDSTASFSTAACWLGVRILDGFFGEGVWGTRWWSESLRLCVRKAGGCRIVVLARRELRDKMSAGGPRVGTP